MILTNKTNVKAVLAIVLTFAGISVAHKTALESNAGLKTNSAAIKSEQIFKQAREAISKKIKAADVKSLLINIKSSERVTIPNRPNQVIQGNIEKEFGLILPDRIRQNFSGDYTTNQSTATWILNGNLFSLKTNVTVGGEPVNVNIDNVNTKEQNISQLKYDAFINIFPIILNASWYPALEFKYIGIAESKDAQAETLAAETRNGTKYNLFFDSKTHLLLMMTESWVNKENKTSENKYFFSDYQEKSGLLVATKIIVEKNGQVVEEKIVQDLKVNPTFKPNFFDVK